MRSEVNGRMRSAVLRRAEVVGSHLMALALDHSILQTRPRILAGLSPALILTCVYSHTMDFMHIS